MAEVTHVIKRSAGTSFTLASATFTTPADSNYKFAAADLEASTEYLIFVFGTLAGSSSSGNSFYCRLEEVSGAGVLTGSNMRVEPAIGGSSNCATYSYLGKFTTDSTARDIEWQFRSGGGGSTVATRGIMMVAIKTADLAAADFKHAEDTTGIVTVSSTVWEDSLASVTIGDGSSDWWILGFANFSMNSTSDDARVVLDVGGTEYKEIQREAEDTTNIYPLGTAVYLEAVASSTTAKVKVRTTGDVPDMDHAVIIALRLDAFEDHFGEHDTTTDVAMSVVDTVVSAQVMSATTDTAAARTWMCMGSCFEEHGDNRGLTGRWIEWDVGGGDTTIAGELFTAANTNTEIWRQNTTDKVPIQIGGETATTIADAAALRFELKCWEGRDINPVPHMTESDMAAWTWELASVAGAISATVPMVIGAPSVDLEGQGKLDATVPMVFGAPSVDLTDATLVGPISATVPMAFAKSLADLEGPGKLDALVQMAMGAPVVDLKGPGKLDALVTLIIGAPSVDLKGPGKLDALVQMVIGAPSVDLLGDGKLDALVTLIIGAPSVDLLGDGKLDATVPMVIGAPSVDLTDATPPEGAISATVPMVIAAPTIDLEGDGKLDALVQMILGAPSVDLKGDGKLDALVQILIGASTVDLEGKGKLDALVQMLFGAPSVDLKGTGKLDATVPMVFGAPVVNLTDAGGGAILATVPMAFSKVLANLVNATPSVGGATKRHLGPFMLRFAT